MYTNPQFKDLVDGGAKVSVACRVLTKREMAPMFYGWAAGGSYWAECLNWASKLISSVRNNESEKVLARILELDLPGMVDKNRSETTLRFHDDSTVQLQSALAAFLGFEACDNRPKAVSPDPAGGRDC